MSEMLITGGCGFIGSHLTDRLIKDGHNVTVLDNLSRGRLENVHPEAMLWNEDIQDYGVVDILVEKADAVFHLAALARVRPSIDDPVTYHETNVNGTLNILEACRKYGKKIIFASSSSVFGNQKLPYYEGTPKDPMNPYAMQKYMGELYLKLYGELYGLDYSIVRYFNVYGERQLTEGAYACVMGIFEEQKKRGEPLTIFGDGEQRRDFTYVKEAVDATVRCLQPEARQQDFNIGRGDNRSVKQIADMISPNQTHLPAVPSEMKATLCFNEKAKKILGWNPKVNVEDFLNGTST